MTKQEKTYIIVDNNCDSGDVMSYMIEVEDGFSNYYFCEQLKSPFYAPHCHSHIEFVFVTEGELEISVENKATSVTAGFVVAIMPYEVHSYKGDEQCQVFVIACPIEYFHEYRQMLMGKVFEPSYVKISKAHNVIIDEIIKDNFSDDLKKKALIYYTISALLNNCVIKETDTFEYETYRNAVMYISAHYTEAITLKKTALYTGVTPTHLSHVLNSGGKPGFLGIVNSLRAYHAKLLLEQKKYSISEVAMESGFGSIRNFNRIFKEYFNCNPKDIVQRKK